MSEINNQFSEFLSKQITMKMRQELGIAGTIIDSDTEKQLKITEQYIRDLLTTDAMTQSFEEVNVGVLIGTMRFFKKVVGNFEEDLSALAQQIKGGKQ